MGSEMEYFPNLKGIGVHLSTDLNSTLREISGTPREEAFIGSILNEEKRSFIR